MWHPESILDASGHLDEGVVHAWLDDQLAPEAATQVEEHAAGCAACSAMVAEARGLVAGASRVLSSLDEPAAGRVPGRDAMLGIVTAAGRAAPSAAAPAGAPAQGARRDVRRWTTRRVSLLAAAALVFVTGTVVLRDSGTVREMVQADQAMLGDSAVAISSAPEAASTTSEAASTGTAANGEAPGAPAGSAPAGGLPGGVGTAATRTATESRVDQRPQPQRLLERPEAVAAAKSSPSVGSVGSTSGAAGAAEREASASFRNPVRAMAQSNAAPSLPPPTAASSPPAPAPAPASPRTGTVRAQDSASDEAGRAREIEASRDAAGRGMRTSTADERRQLQASDARSAQELSAEQRPAAVRTSAEIQAMVRMVSTCWRIAGSDSVVELLPPDSRNSASAAPGGSPLWIPGWLRMGRDATNPDRVWWLPLADSASARVRLDDAASPDLVITPRRDAALVRRIPRTDSLATWESIPRSYAAGSAASVRCP